MFKNFTEKNDLKAVIKQLNHIAEGIDKLVFLQEFNLKSAGVPVEYPRKGENNDQAVVS